MANLMISTSAVRKKVGELQQKNTEFVRLVNAMTEQVKALDKMWEGGDARDVFAKNYNNSVQQFEAFAKGIEKYCAALETMAGEHDANEAANAEIAASKG